MKFVVRGDGLGDHVGSIRSVVPNDGGADVDSGGRLVLERAGQRGQLILFT